MGRSSLQTRRRANNLNEILDAARELVREVGPGALTLGAVAAKVGVSTPALYHYFDSKTSLMQTLVVAGVTAEADVLVAAAEGWTGPESQVLGAAVRAMYDYYRPNLSAFRLIYFHLQMVPLASIGMDDALKPRLHPQSRRMFDALQAVLVRGQASGDVQPELDTRTAVVAAHAAAVGMLTMIALADHVLDPLKQRDLQLVDSLSRILETGVRAAR